MGCLRSLTEYHSSTQERLRQLSTTPDIFSTYPISSVSNETYYGTVDPYNRFYGRILSVVTYGPLTIGRFTDSNSITDSKLPI